MLLPNWTWRCLSCSVHVAEIIANWSINKRGVCNRWSRLLIIGLVLGSDTYSIIKDPSPVTSYTTHAGGMIYGYLCGIILFDDLERTWFHTHVGKPAAFFFAVLLPLLGVLYYLYTPFPPDPIAGGIFVVGDSSPPCCWQLLRCLGGDSSLSRDHFGDAFYCQNEGRDLYTKPKYSLVNTCSEFEDEYAHHGF